MDKSEFAETSDDSQTPIDLATSVDNRRQFSSNGYRKVSLTSDCCNGYDVAEESINTVPTYKRHRPVPLSGTKSKSFDTSTNGSGISMSPTLSPNTKISSYSYGKRNSLTRSRFLLVRTSCGHGKEAFKRITMPGSGSSCMSIEFMKSLIEKVMKQGRVLSVRTLPELVALDCDDQLLALPDCQKVEVLFAPYEEESNTVSDVDNCSTISVQMNEVTESIDCPVVPSVIIEEDEVIDDSLTTSKLSAKLFKYFNWNSSDESPMWTNEMFLIAVSVVIMGSFGFYLHRKYK